MNRNYKPKIFCGNGDITPPGYDALGTRYECLRKGFGVGASRTQRTTKSDQRSHSTDLYLYGFILVLVTIVVAMVVYLYLSISDSSYKDDEKNKKYNVRKK